MVLEIGAFLISLQPPGAKQIVVDLFGTADKLALNVAIVLGALALAALLGVLARYHRPWTTGGFSAIAILGLFASLRDPLVDGLLAIAAAILGVVVANASLGWLLQLATPSGAAEMPDWGRRRFLGTSIGVAALAVAGGGIGRVLLNSRADAAPTATSIPPAVDPVAALPAGARLAVEGITPIVVKNRDFYRIDTQLLTPRLDASTWKLSVDGMVDHPFSLTYAELLAMEMHEEYVTIACVSNEVGGDLVGNALWKGVRLRELLDRAGVRAGRHADRRARLRRLDGRLPDRLARSGGPRGAGGGGDERRAAARRARLPGAPDRARAVRIRVRDEVADQDRSHHAGGVRRLLGAARLGQGGADPDPVPHRRSAARQLAPGRAGAGRRRRLGAGPGHRAGRGAGRQRCVGRGGAFNADLRRDLGPVAVPVERDPGGAHPQRACHRRRRRSPDRHGDSAPARWGARPSHDQRQRRGLIARLDARRRIGGVPAPTAPLFIVNPIAGNGRAHGIVPRIQAWLQERGIEARLLETREPGHAERLAAAATDLGHDRVIAVGGDGTIQEVINGLLSSGVGTDGGPPALGLVPSGRGNDMARSVNLPIDPMACLPIALGPTTHPFDIGSASSPDGSQRYFGAAGGVGFDAAVAYTMAVHRRFWMRGEAGYFLGTLNELRRYRNSELRGDAHRRR